MKTFRVLKIILPASEDFAQIQLSIEDFEELATSQKFSPLFENDESIFFLDGERRILYFASKKGEKP